MMKLMNTDPVVSTKQPQNSFLDHEHDADGHAIYSDQCRNYSFHGTDLPANPSIFRDE